MFIFGDTHGQWDIFNENLQNLPEISNTVIVAGDFGYWPFAEFDLKRINTLSFNIYFCPGNHENWEELELLEKKYPDTPIIEIVPHIFYCTFGSVLSVEGHNILFCGGADSIDKNSRKIGLDWFPQEVITIADMKKLPERKDIDIVVSHTAPLEIVERLDEFFYKQKDPSCKMLSIVHDYYKPMYWFHGHFHMYKEFYLNNTYFYSLDREVSSYIDGHIIDFSDGKVKKMISV